MLTVEFGKACELWNKAASFKKGSIVKVKSEKFGLETALVCDILVKSTCPTTSDNGKVWNMVNLLDYVRRV